jgi:hypothetical protein
MCRFVWDGTEETMSMRHMMAKELLEDQGFDINSWIRNTQEVHILQVKAGEAQTVNLPIPREDEDEQG